VKRVAPDLERLMWLIAEESDTAAMTEFGERFPELRGELAKRMSMVHALRVAGKTAAAPRESIPRFAPPKPSSGFRSDRVLWMAGAFAAVAVALGSYSLTSRLLGSPSLPDAPPAVERTVVHPPEGNPRVAVPDSSAQELGPPAMPGPPEAIVRASERPRTIRMDGVPLLVALEAIASEAGMSLEIAPGMPNPEISVSYEGIGVVEILQDLGRRHGFTPFDQGTGSILVIPAVDARSSGGAEEPGPSGRSGNTPAQRL
jgi:hypothetical protein